MKMRIALASSDGNVVNRHFGKCESFAIYDIETETNNTQFIETRNIAPACNGNGHSDESLINTVKLISDCRRVVASRIGFGATKLLQENGIESVEFGGLVTEYFERGLQNILRIYRSPCGR
ncbi:MAG: hypothetical protein LBH59_06505 [Planctomycetaceae bacterium]|jgi:predicted Fe-Mo cluster-binding NifX family protein|nr:hypothetical protein [Planctomycetaceae bacterium]